MRSFAKNVSQLWGIRFLCSAQFVFLSALFVSQCGRSVTDAWSSDVAKQRCPEPSYPGRAADAAKPYASCQFDTAKGAIWVCGGPCCHRKWMECDAWSNDWCFKVTHGRVSTTRSSWSGLCSAFPCLLHYQPQLLVWLLLRSKPLVLLARVFLWLSLLESLI